MTLWTLREKLRKAESVMLMFVLWQCFNCRWVSSGGMEQVLFRASWNRIFRLLIRLKSRCARWASCHPAFMVLVLIKRMKRGGESKISFCYLRSSTASSQIYHEWGGVILCVWSVCRLSQLWLVFVLLGVDATLGNGCGIWEHLLSFNEEKCLQVYSRTLVMGYIKL